MFQVLMNIILFCRVLSVDFSDVVKVKRTYKEVPSTNMFNGNSNGFSSKNNVTKNYNYSIFDEVEEEKKDRIDWFLFSFYYFIVFLLHVYLLFLTEFYIKDIDIFIIPTYRNLSSYLQIFTASYILTLSKGNK